MKHMSHKLTYYETNVMKLSTSDRRLLQALQTDVTRSQVELA